MFEVNCEYKSRLKIQSGWIIRRIKWDENDWLFCKKNRINPSTH
jgi:hypothetical protein